MSMIIAATASETASGDDPIIFRGKFDQSIPLAAKTGFHGIELHINDSEKIDRQHLYALLNQNHMMLTSIGTGSAYETEGICLGSDKASIREKAVHRLEQHMITASPYHTVVIVGLIAGRISDCGYNKELFIKNLVESLKLCGNLALKYDVYIGFEVMNRFEGDYGTTIAEACNLMKMINKERVMLHLDTVHMNIEEDSIGDAIRSAAGKVIHVHVAETNRWYPGHGHYDFKETLKALKDIQYNGALALEITNKPDSITAGKKSLSYLGGILDVI